MPMPISPRQIIRADRGNHGCDVCSGKYTIVHIMGVDLCPACAEDTLHRFGKVMNDYREEFNVG